MPKKTNNIIEIIFETFLFNSRFIAILAVLGSLIASVVLFIKSTIEVFFGVVNFTSEIETTFHISAETSNELMKTLIMAIDEYLIATVLFIFCMGIYELFIRRIDTSRQTNDTRPGWMKINSIDELKNMLGKVIMMVLIVSFFKYSLENKYDKVLDLLYFGLGIFFVSVALYLSHSSHSHKDNHQEK